MPPSARIGGALSRPRTVLLPVSYSIVVLLERSLGMFLTAPSTRAENKESCLKINWSEEE